MVASWKKHTLQFKFEAGTSRGVLQTHDVYYIKLFDESAPHIVGIGEAAPLKGLSIDDRPDFEQYLEQFTSELNFWDDNGLRQFPSVQFALETAIRDLQNGGRRKIFDTGFFNHSQPIPINGLVWMADKETMKKQVKKKIASGFSTIKLKVGAIGFDDELDLLRSIRLEFSPGEIEIRVDANGAFKPVEALEKLKKLSEFTLHSIEQPIQPGQRDEMAELCSNSPIPIALDEELIGLNYPEEKEKLLQAIRPQYIILKPTLLGGFKATEEWIKGAETLGIGWWITSALESNIGLNAICQFTSKFGVNIPQGLGTGGLYHNNILSPLIVEKGFIHYDSNAGWETIESC